MSTRSRGKRLATGITVAVGVGSVAVAGVSAAAVYAATPSVIARTTLGTDNSTQGTTPKPSGSTGSGNDIYGSRQDGTRRSKSYGSTTPVQPGNGGTVHGRSSGS
ncbi:hypothetical protein DC347_07585 [Pseudarthrobacter sp. AG30]|uniref:hypothetical protein n=1 Tax=Pseudarthrobacter sp. AG30 TaxID=2249742 RepID=UPI000D642E1A|nr:hypothetical protein [Pseudarthrobacter sp. AG30]RAX17473.1 hypothetical protein DC347_07585 [Pseudarthrobacter sp. AG30]